MIRAKAVKALEASKTVGIIACTKKQGAGFDNLGLQTVRNMLVRERVPHFAHYHMNGDEEQNVDKKDIRAKQINLMTVHQSKGLEFDVVLFIDPRHALMNRNPSTADVLAHNNLMYVAVTRARQELHMFLSERSLVNKILIKPLEEQLITPFIVKSSEQLNRFKDDHFAYIYDNFEITPAEDEQYIRRDSDILLSASVDTQKLLALYKYTLPQVNKVGIACDVKTWDHSKQTQDSIEEVIGLYV
jgi:hypothetical protein